jgi:hypothetical protein
LVFSAELKLAQIQKQIQDHGHSDALMFEEKLASTELEEALTKEGVFWQEKAWLNWHLEGDRNTKFFHRLTKIHNSTKQIQSLQDGETVITDPNLISEHIVSFYKKLFCTNSFLQDSLLAEEVIPTLVTDEINALMTMLPSNSEIKSAIFSLNKDSAAGPDGFGAFFFQHY